MLMNRLRAAAKLQFFLTFTFSIFFIIISSTSKLEAKSARKKSWPYRSALLIEADTGQVLKSFQPRNQVIPASLVKMMTLLITLEQIKAKSVSFKDIVTTSRKASKIGGQQVYLRQGERFPLVDLLKAVAISSANDAAYAVAEHIADDTEIFVEMMNTRAKQLGMTDTSYVNVHGLPPGRRLPPNITSARDMAIIARELLKYPITKQWGTTKHTPFRDGKFILTNTNRLVGKFRGLDGIKTGSYRKAGYSIVATAKRGDLRLIAVVMSSSHPRRRFKEASRLLAWGFGNYSWYKGMEPGSDHAFSVKVINGQKDEIHLKSMQKFRKLVKRGEAGPISVRKEIPASIPAPIHEGQKVGRLIYELEGKKMGEVQLAATESVDRLSLLQTIFRLQ